VAKAVAKAAAINGRIALEADMPNLSRIWTDRLQAAWLQRGLLALLLLPLSVLYGCMLGLRRFAYSSQICATYRMPVPVIVVGNLVVGGAGKTPTTLALITLLRKLGFSPGVVSRGYGRLRKDLVLVTPQSPAHDTGDEPLLIHLRTGAPVAVGQDRVAAARALLAQHPQTDILLSDDGLQHWRLGRDVQVVVFDERGVGNGWLLPAGPLREPHRAGVVPPHSIVLYNAPAASTDWPGFTLHRHLTGVTRLRDWWNAPDTAPEPLENFAQLSVLAAPGVARPERFFGMLRSAGLVVTECPLTDHYDFATLPWPLDSPMVIVTEKDAVKLDPHRQGMAQVWVATLDFVFPVGFEFELVRLLPHTAKQ
jgi:tetraacyldisaccharide 4'-kinase